MRAWRWGSSSREAFGPIRAAFFCGLNREAVSAAELDEAQALCYLRRQGGRRRGKFAEGVNLVCARGRALGFAKRIGNRVNNMYPNTLRIIKR